jgi:virulence-associated protein VagC
MRAKLFMDGHDLAVLIPDEIAFADTDVELEIVRNGDVIKIFPVRQRETATKPAGPTED